MGALLIHLVGLALFGVFYRRWPRLKLGILFLLWGVGILLLRFLPGVLGSSAGRGEALSPAAAYPLAILSWIGAAALLRSLIGLALWEREPTRWLRIFRWMFIAALALAVIVPSLAQLWACLAIPMLWSFRWRKQSGALTLVGAGAVGFVSILLCIVSYDHSYATWQEVVPSLAALPRLVQALTLIYAIAATPAAATRIHLSVRRINRRLVSSHILAGLIPIILISAFLLLSAALYSSSYRGTVGARILQDESTQARERMLRNLNSGGTIGSAPFGNTPGQIVLARENGSAARVLEGTPSFPADSLLTHEESSAATPLLWDGRILFLRARLDTRVAGSAYRVEALAPIDSLRMERISEILGMPVRISPQIVVVSHGGGIRIGSAEKDDSRVEFKAGESADSASSGKTRSRASAAPADSSFEPEGRSIGPETKGSWQLPGGAIVSCLRWVNGHWATTSIPVYSAASFGEQISALFSKTRENPLAAAALIVLGLLAVLILVAIGITISVVMGMGRSITQAVTALTQGAVALGKGRLDHRIPLEGKDELWSVAASFNQMAQDLEKMRAMELESQRLEEELRLARQIQDRLLPATPPILDRVELAGISLPAREVGGDYFDYFVMEDGTVAIAVADVSGKGAPAAMLMSSFRAALRSQDLAVLGPAEVLARINHFIHSSIDPGRFITAFLGVLDQNSGEFRYANAGHDAPTLILADGSAHELLGGGLILGLLPQIVYEEARAKVEPGSLIAIYTDGITEARNPGGDFFGSERLLEVLQGGQGETCETVQRRVFEAVREFASTAAQSDDITLVLVRRRS